ncbi:NADPH oxidase activator 1-like isoform X1 [Pristis pectinata]|uniref:NADPH oxidase activator 1-like isoform X1 n=1 Tax=Pristis pectinata TaxID=685728 RepID=UPI00223E8741|nr:NADPH oxidase activator 1-like isoform X1 [Pristis pectinata]
MSYRDLIGDWDRAVRAIDRRDWLSARDCLSSVAEPNSRIYFNLGCVRLHLGDLPGALKAFDLTIAKDERLAVCFFQRGIVHLRLNMFDEAEGDFRHALTNLRGHSVIDYTQLGLRHRLYSWEVLYNMAAVYSRLGQWAKAQQALTEAVCLKVPGSNAKLDSALSKVKCRNTFELVDVPEGIVFRPSKHEVDELKLKDFLGTSKVISSIVPNDSFAGFGPLRPMGLASAETSTAPQTFPSTPAETAAQMTPASAAALRKVSPNPDSVIMKVHYEYTVATRVEPGTSYTDLLNIIKSKLGHQSGRMQLSYKDEEKQELAPIRGEADLEKMWNQIVERHITVWCKSADPLAGRQVLYKTLALYNYSGQGPEDMEFNEGDVIDVLSEVNEEWLEGHSNGNIGIFPRCFVGPQKLETTDSKKPSCSEVTNCTQTGASRKVYFVEGCRE